MAAYYNELDAFCAQWLRNLMARGLIASGEVDARSIEEVQPDDLKGFQQAHFFAGIGGWSFAARLAGWPDDLTLWTGSCPCQPFSEVGQRTGKSDNRHLWPAFYQLVCERRPSAVAGEQVASDLGYRWLAGIRSDLEAAGYAAGAVDLCAASIGAPHARQRLWWIATTGAIPDAGSQRLERGAQDGAAAPPVERSPVYIQCADGKARQIEPGIEPLAYGVSARMGRLRAYGNAIVPQVAAEVLKVLMEARP